MSNTSTVTVQTLLEMEGLYVLTSVYFLTPDGLTLTCNAEPYTSIEDAKVNFDIWAKQFESQGYYKTFRGEKIPLDWLWGRMLFCKTPYHPKWYQSPSERRGDRF